MRVSKFESRSDIAGLGLFGKHNGKLFVDDRYADGSFRRLPVYDAANPDSRAMEKQSTYPNHLVGCDVAYGDPNRGNQFVTYSSIAGVRSTPFFSTKGATAGRTFFCEAGRILRDDDTILYQTTQTSGLPYLSLGLVSPMHMEILHETLTTFVVHGRLPDSLNRSVIFVIHKITGALFAGQYFRGGFSVQRIGKLPDNSQGSTRTAFLILANTAIAEVGSFSTVQPSTHRPLAESSPSAHMYVMSVDELDDPTSANGLWLVKGIRLGFGTNGAVGEVVNQRMQIGWDDSLVELDEDGRVTSIYVVGSDRTVGGTDSVLPTASGSPATAGLLDNLTLFKFAIDADTTSITQVWKRLLQLPAGYASATWTFNGTSSNRAALISGKAFISNIADQPHLCVYLNRVGFEAYQSAASTDEQALARTQPNIPPTLIRVPINQNYDFLIKPEHIQFPVNFGLGHHESTMLLREDRAVLALPSTTAVHRVYTYTNSGNDVVLLDIAAGTYERVHIPRDPIQSPALLACGWAGNEILVVTRTQGCYVIDDGPEVDLHIMGDVVVGQTVQVRVTVSRPAEVELRVFGGSFDTGETTTLQVEDQLFVDVLVKNDVSVHAVRCDPQSGD